jgi:hypothetical protein
MNQSFASTGLPRFGDELTQVRTLAEEVTDLLRVGKSRASIASKVADDHSIAAPISVSRSPTS